MSLFQDATGKQWRVELTLGSLRRLKSEAEFDLSAMSVDERFATALMGDPVTLANVCWVLCREQAVGTTRDQFEDAIDGDAVERLQVAVFEAIVDFFHRAQAESIKAKLPDLRERMRQAIESRLNELTSNNSDGNSPGLLDVETPAA